MQGLVDDVRCAALQGLSSIPPEVRQIVLSKLEPHRWSKQHAWCFRLAASNGEGRPMPSFHGWQSGREGVYAHVNMLYDLLVADVQAVGDADI